MNDSAPSYIPQAARWGLPKADHPEDHGAVRARLRPPAQPWRMLARLAVFATSAAPNADRTKHGPHQTRAAPNTRRAKHAPHQALRRVRMAARSPARRKGGSNKVLFVWRAEKP
jgi:hypothetical protein